MSRFIRYGLLAVVVVAAGGSAVQAQQTPFIPRHGDLANPMPFNPFTGEQVPGLPTGWVFGTFDPEAPHVINLVSPTGVVHPVQFCGTGLTIEQTQPDGSTVLYFFTWTYHSHREIGLVHIAAFVADDDAFLGLGLLLYENYFGPYAP